MKSRTSIALPILLLSILTLSIYGMEQAKKELHPLLRLPIEVQSKIFFPCYMDNTTITYWEKLNGLEAVITRFCTLKKVCKDFNESLKLPWSNWTNEKKDKTAEEILCLSSGCGVVFRLYTFIKYDGKLNQEAS